MKASPKSIGKTSSKPEKLEGGKPSPTERRRQRRTNRYAAKHGRM